ncbi:MAG: hypothetical protein LBE56_12345 [Tannerella sp.]|jgi:hypothetical protein|nr:hypothetical protein [Tannerella sp.]
MEDLTENKTDITISLPLGVEDTPDYDVDFYMKFTEDWIQANKNIYESPIILKDIISVEEEMEKPKQIYDQNYIDGLRKRAMSWLEHTNTEDYLNKVRGN